MEEDEEDEDEEEQSGSAEATGPSSPSSPGRFPPPLVPSHPPSPPSRRPQEQQGSRHPILDERELDALRQKHVGDRGIVYHSVILFYNGSRTLHIPLYQTLGTCYMLSTKMVWSAVLAGKKDFTGLWKELDPDNHWERFPDSHLLMGLPGVLEWLPKMAKNKSRRNQANIERFVELIRRLADQKPELYNAHSIRGIFRSDDLPFRSAAYFANIKNPSKPLPKFVPGFPPVLQSMIHQTERAPSPLAVDATPIECSSDASRTPSPASEPPTLVDDKSRPTIAPARPSSPCGSSPSVPIMVPNSPERAVDLRTTPTALERLRRLQRESDSSSESRSDRSLKRTKVKRGSYMRWRDERAKWRCVSAMAQHCKDPDLLQATLEVDRLPFYDRSFCLDYLFMLSVNETI